MKSAIEIFCQILVLFFLPIYSLAQDTLVFLNGKTQVVHVLKVSDEKLEFADFPVDTSAPVYSIRRVNIKQINFYNGVILSNSKLAQKQEVQLIEVHKAKDVKPDQTSKRKWGTVVKTDIFGWFISRGTLMIEQQIKGPISIEATYGFRSLNLGTEINQSNELKGEFYKAGLRYYFKSDTKQNGFYIKPEFVRTNYQYTRSGYTFYRIGTFGLNYYSFNNAVEKVKGNGILLNFGWQKILAGKWVIDVYGGAGVGQKSKSLHFFRPYPIENEMLIEFDDEGPNLSYDNFGFKHQDFNQTGIVLQGGFKLGVIF